MATQHATTSSPYIDPHYRSAPVNLSPHDCIVILIALGTDGEQARVGRILAKQCGIDWQSVFSQDNA